MYNSIIDGWTLERFRFGRLSNESHQEVRYFAGLRACREDELGIVLHCLKPVLKISDMIFDTFALRDIQLRCHIT
jgi:hypothetical protein